ncbi:Serine/threonine protein kinase [Globisporangium polare]
MSASPAELNEALQVAKNLSREMRESKELCNFVLARLEFLQSEMELLLPQRVNADEIRALLVDALDLFVRFLKRFSGKKLLQRIAASSAIRREVHALHEKINTVFIAADLTDVPLMTEWEQHEAADINVQRLESEKVARKRSNLVSDLSGSALVEALTELRFEIDSHADDSEESIASLAQVLAEVVKLTGATIPDIPVWFVRRDDVVLLGEALGIGSFGEVYRGVWRGQEVCVKQLYVDTAETQRDFLKETAVWHDLSHPNIVKMHGGCHVGSPLFFVSEFATNGNFTDYFKVETKEENKRSMWRLFHQAALGLAYLHENRKVHCDIKCDNMLVDGNGIAKLCDFGFSHTKTLSIGSVKDQPSTLHWKAPECLLEQGPAAYPTFTSDIYSFGMSIIEAKIGEPPWLGIFEDELVNLLDGGYPRPDRLFTDDEWELVQGMTAFETTERWTLDQAIAKMAELASPLNC